jgi:hypothetical protein
MNASVIPTLYPHASCSPELSFVYLSCSVGTGTRISLRSCLVLDDVVKVADLLSAPLCIPTLQLLDTIFGHTVWAILVCCLLLLWVASPHDALARFLSAGFWYVPASFSRWTFGSLFQAAATESRALFQHKGWVHTTSSDPPPPILLAHPTSGCRDHPLRVPCPLVSDTANCPMLNVCAAGSRCPGSPIACTSCTLSSC